MRELCLELLELFGYDTIGEDNGEEGVQKFLKHQNRIDVVLLDLIMLKMDGFEAFAQLIRIKPDVKVVINSGFAISAVDCGGLHTGNFTRLVPLCRYLVGDRSFFLNQFYHLDLSRTTRFLILVGARPG